MKTTAVNPKYNCQSDFLVYNVIECAVQLYHLS